MTAQDQPVVFVSLTGDEAIKLYDLDPQSGALELRATSPAHGPSGALFLHPTRPVLYDAHVMSTTLASFHLDTTSGELTLINKVDTRNRHPRPPDYRRRRSLSANGLLRTGGGVTVHRLGDDGAIGDLVQRIDTGPKAHAVLLTEGERFVFVPHVYPNNKTSQFRFDASTGQLSPNDPPVLAPPAKESPAPGTSASARSAMSRTSSTSRATRSPPTALTPSAAPSPSSKTSRPCPRTTPKADTPPTSKSIPTASGATHPIAATTALSATTSTPTARSARLGTTQCQPARARSISTRPARTCTALEKPPTA